MATRTGIDFDSPINPDGAYFNIGQEVATIDSCSDGIIRGTLYGRRFEVPLSNGQPIEGPFSIRIKPDGSSEVCKYCE